MNIRWKRYYPLVILFILAPVLLVSLMGSQRIIAYTVPGAKIALPAASSGEEAIDLFDPSVVHRIQIQIAADDYQLMLTTYKTTGVKEYFHADVVIDGTLLQNVGLRLKGNASLRTAVGGGFGRGGFGGNPGGDPGNNAQAPRQRDNNPAGPGANQPDPGGNPQGPPGGGFGPPGMGGGDGSEVKIPLMIKFNEFVDSQRYQGRTSLALRTYGITQDAAILNEPVTNAAFLLVGIPATQTAFTGLTINDGEEQLYSISEVINETYLERVFPNSAGVLYKAEVGANLNYLGEDPSAYARRFTQQTRVDDADLAPLIAFTRFLSKADDAAFEKALPEHLDVDAFATYLAVNNLLVNGDALVGMNNNYYLYYNEAERRFSLLYWDGNESLAKMAFGGQGPQADIYYENSQSRGPRMGGTNLLVKRFFASEKYKALYEKKISEVYRRLYASGAIRQQVEQYAALVRQASQSRPTLIDLDKYDAAVAKVLTFLEQRQAYLASLPLLQ